MNATGHVKALLFCCERSGSNLIRCMLDAHPRVSAPNTMGLGHLCAAYALGRRDLEAWRSLVRECCRRINASAHYTDVSVDEHELTHSVPVHDAPALYAYPYWKYMTQNGADRLVIKEHRAWRLADFFLRGFPGSRIIVQVRDPRDHAASCKKLGRLYAAYHGSVARAARVWSTDQREALRLRQEYGNALRIHRYEDLVQRPRQTLRDICDFLEIEWDEGMLEFHLKQAERARRSDTYLHRMWAGLDRRVTPNSVGQWKSHLRQFELQVVEREAGDLLVELNYEPSPVRNHTLRDLLQVVLRLCATLRYVLVTVGVWIAWIVRTREFRVPLDVVRGDAVYEHLPYQQFRDRLGYRL